jgi:hypothetical protein
MKNISEVNKDTDVLPRRVVVACDSKVREGLLHALGHISSRKLKKSASRLTSDQPENPDEDVELDCLN